MPLSPLIIGKPLIFSKTKTEISKTSTNTESVTLRQKLLIPNINHYKTFIQDISTSIYFKTIRA